MEISEGRELWKHGHKEDGAFKMAGGGFNVASGVSGFAALGGSSLAAGLSVGAGSLAVGLGAGHYGDKKSKELGWYHDGDGNPQRLSEYCADKGQAVDDWMTKRGHPYLGSALGGATVVAEAGAHVPHAIAAAAVGAGHDIGTSLAHDHRAKHYANYDVNVDGGSESLADYDDKQRAAVERAETKRFNQWKTNVEKSDDDNFFSSMKERK
jgi:hypothetical protein